jgi:hypothetical protein
MRSFCSAAEAWCSWSESNRRPRCQPGVELGELASRPSVLRGVWRCEPDASSFGPNEAPTYEIGNPYLEATRRPEPPWSHCPIRSTLHHG